MLNQAVCHKDAIILDVHVLTPDEHNDTIKLVEEYLDLRQWDLALNALEPLSSKVGAMLREACAIPLRRAQHQLSALLVLQDTLNFIHGYVTRMQEKERN